MNIDTEKWEKITNNNDQVSWKLGESFITISKRFQSDNLKLWKVYIESNNKIIMNTPNMYSKTLANDTAISYMTKYKHG